MKEVFLTPEQHTHLYMHSYVFADGYLYNRTEFYTFVRVERIHEDFSALRQQIRKAMRTEWLGACRNPCEEG